MGELAVVDKDPNAHRTYSINWANFGDNDGSIYDPGFLQGDTLVDSTWILDAGLTEDVSAFTSTVASIRISGGRHGKQYKAVNRVTTANGEIDDRTLLIKVAHK